jgi:hypothetical protein
MNTKYSLILGTVLFFSVSLFAQDKNIKKAPATKQTSTKPAPTQEDIANQAQAQQKAWMDYSTPGPMQKMLASQNGNWHESLVFWMAPGAPETKAESDCNNHMILGDRYQESTHRGMMMNMPFEGRSIIGYDNAKKMFQSSWIDNMGTGILFCEGAYDEATKSVTFRGTSVDPSTGKTERVRQIMTFIDDRNQTMEMYMTKDGKEYKSMFIKFTKQD